LRLPAARPTDTTRPLSLSESERCGALRASAQARACEHKQTHANAGAATRVPAWPRSAWSG
jgi:hypothetical protein